MRDLRLFDGYAVLIGVNDNQVTNLAVPAVGNGVRALRDVLIDPERCAYRPENVMLLTGEEAAKEVIFKALYGLGERTADDPQATAIIYFSGHGIRDLSANQYYLVPYDTGDMRTIRENSIALEDFTARISAIRSRRLLLIFDAAPAPITGFGVESIFKEISAEAAPFPLDLPASGTLVLGDRGQVKQTASGELSEGEGRAILVSASDGQKSYMNRDGTMGLFTEQLIEALMGRALHDEAANVIYVTDLMSWVVREVRKSAADLGVEQVPVSRTSGNFPIALLDGGSGGAIRDSDSVSDEEEAPDATVVRDSVTGEFLRLQPGFRSDFVDSRERDHLGIEQEVANIANVLMFKRVQPPLSLGLFGDWGSGKSFFMRKLQRRVQAVAEYYRREEEANGEKASWCSRVVQIEFNAWHYSDANLWASLVTHIYDELERELSDAPTDQELLAELAGKMQVAQGIYSMAKRQLSMAEDQVKSAQGVLHTAVQKRKGEQDTLWGLINDVKMLLRGSSGAHEELEKAANALGYPEAAESFQELAALNDDIHSFSKRAGALAVNVLEAPWTLVVLVLLIIIGLPLLVTVGLEALASQMDLLQQRVVEISSLIGGLIISLRILVGQGLSAMNTVEQGFKEAKRVRQQAIEKDEKVARAEAGLKQAEIEEQAARDNLREAERELKRLQTDLEELRPERKLQHLIEERINSATYSRHLSIISLIRADFEKMSDYLLNMAGREFDREGKQPIQRIILYIDDLDRCRPQRVVEVLEAVHMLLAFRLFVVVVGVDPRWLRHSLAHHYAETLPSVTRADLYDGRTGPAHDATPQDYLEKIFQIPFTLRPVAKGGFQKMVDDLLNPLPPPRQRPAGRPLMAPGEGGQEREAEVPEPEIGGDVLKEIGDQEGDREGMEETTVDRAPVETTAVVEEVEISPLNPEQLTFQSWEKADIERLWPLFRTPRTIKRFINIYRVLRAGLSSRDEIERFEGRADLPGEYQVALILLAIVTAFPNEATEFLYRLDSWLDDHPEEDQCNWADLMAALYAPGAEARDPKEQVSDGERNDESKEGQGTGDEDDGRQHGLSERLLHCLEMVTSSGFQEPFSQRTLRRWSLRVSRYSFSVQPIEPWEPEIPEA